MAGKAGLSGAGAVWDAVEREEAALGDDGRILVRASGTEPLVRVMVEPTAETTERVASRIAAIVHDTLS